MEKGGIDILKKIVAVCAAFALAVIWYATSYQPLQKSKAYISVMNRNFTSLNEFLNGFGSVLDMPSPIGHEELVRNFGSITINIINRYGKSNPEVAGQAVAFIEDRFEPVIASGKGMSFSQNLFVLAGANQAAFLQTRDSKYWAQAEQYYLKGVELSPRRPQYLYGLFDLYRMVGDGEKALNIANRILEVWPDDERVKGEVIKIQSTFSTEE